MQRLSASKAVHWTVKIAPTMHQKSLFGDQKSKKNLGGGHCLPQTLSLPPQLAVSRIDAACLAPPLLELVRVERTLTDELKPVNGSRPGGRRACGTGVAGVTRSTSNWSGHSAAGPRWRWVPYITGAALAHHLGRTGHRSNERFETTAQHF